ncbi:MAG TPA: FtsW/RodA/SpoVE family cell cycle protein [Anaerolineae bacterium]|nr:FtsW/RodA/SpoVE family cell cycle protein [Anaerolineae bacterium]
MIDRRAWRSFDLVLFLTLLALVAFGVTMIYSATVNTAGVGNPVQRQSIYFLVGLALFLLAATFDYTLLSIPQHPIALLTPLVLLFAQAAILVNWRASALKESGLTLAAADLRPDILPLLLGALLVAVVFLADRAWLRALDLPLTKALALAGALAAALLVTYLFTRFEPGRILALRTYLAPVALAALYAVDCLTLRFTDVLRNPLYVLILALLGLTLEVGQVAGGAQSWLGAGAVQPSELSKILLVVVLAHYFAEHEQQMDRIGTVLTSLLVVAVPALLIYSQPDLGTALTLVPLWAAIAWMAGLRLRHLFFMVLAGLGALPIAWFGLQDYMRDRLMLFIDPESDPDSYFNVHQSLVSIGSGGLFGKGLTKGSQSQLHFLRVRHTDFIFAVTAEELGFAGAAALIALLGLLIWRMLSVAARSRDTFGRLLASGIAAIVLFQTVINIGMNLGILPVTGLPLPFVSYGGSSLVTLMFGAGLVESVAIRHKKLEFD